MTATIAAQDKATRKTYQCGTKLALGLLSMFLAANSFAGETERNPGVFQSDWAISKPFDGNNGISQYAYTETSVSAHQLTGEVGIQCLAGHDGKNLVLVLFRVFKNGVVHKWDQNDIFEMFFRSKARTDGFIKIGGRYIQSLGAIANPIVIGEKTDDMNGLALVVKEFQGPSETFVKLSASGKTKYGFMFTQKNAAKAISEVLSSCGISNF